MDLEVIPNSKEFKAIGFNTWTNSLRVKVHAKAMKGQANKELVQKLEELFQAKIEITAGEKSKRKKFSSKGFQKKNSKKPLKNSDSARKEQKGDEK
jgi:uncharacterized protein (TIGR00251 family)